MPNQPIARPSTFEDPFDAVAQEHAGLDPAAEAPLQLAPSAMPARPFVPPPVVIETEESDGSITTTTRTLIRSDAAALPRRKPLQREAPPEPPAVSPVRDYILPAILIVVGLALCLLDGMYKGDDAAVPLHAAVGPVTLNIAASLALAIGAVFAASAMGGVAFHEPVPIIIYKLCAVALAPGAIGSLATHWIGGINGDIAGVFIGVAAYFAVFLALFRLPMSDRAVCVLLMFIIRTAVNYMMYRFAGVMDMSKSM